MRCIRSFLEMSLKKSSIIRKNLLTYVFCCILILELHNALHVWNLSTVISQIIATNSEYTLWTSLRKAVFEISFEFNCLYTEKNSWRNFTQLSIKIGTWINWKLFSITVIICDVLNVQERIKVEWNSKV